MRALDLRPTIWLLDDSPTETEFIRAILAPTCTVVSFTDGATLIEALGTSPLPDVLVLDWEMPGLSGIDVCEYLRNNRSTASLAVILLTTHQRPEDVVRGLEAGANDYVFKPFKPVELVARVHGQARRDRLQKQVLSDERSSRVLAEKALQEAQASEARARSAENATVQNLERLQQVQREVEAREVGLLQRSEFERRLIGIVSHDLRNPLSAIGLTATALVHQVSDERHQRGLKRILLAAERATRMIRDLLDFTRARHAGGISLERRASDLHVLVGTVVEEVRVVYPDRSIVVEQSGRGEGTWDPDRIEQVISNLLVNALHYGEPGSPVRVTTRGEADAVLLEVHNRGPLIAPDVLSRIFEPLERGSLLSDQTGRSIGLGLYIVRHLVDVHGGTVTVRSTASEGTTFTVRLPIQSSTEPA